MHPRNATQAAAAAAAFRARLAELGAELLEPVWLGGHTPHRVKCAAGHFCTPRPSGVIRGRGVCRICAGNDSVAAEAAFRARLGELGAELLEPWHWAGSPHRVRCAAGHLCTPRPDHVARGNGICRACAPNDPARAEAAFRARLAELGAELLEPYHGAMRPHRVRCAAGHECAPRPNDILNGHGACMACRGAAWDVFYIVRDPVTGRIKFGITSGDPRPRLGQHHAAKYRERVLVLTGLPDGLAHRLEVAARIILMTSGLEPMSGREYFEAAALPLVLDIVNAYADQIPPTSRPAAV